MPPPADIALHGPTVVWLAVAVIASVATVMSLFGATQRVYRGYWWWTAAMWLAAAGAALHGERAVWPGAVVPAVLLLQAWPVLVLTGLRRFHQRHNGGAPGIVDALLLAACFLVWLTGWVAEWPLVVRSWIYCGGMLLLHGHAARAAWRLDRQARSVSNALLSGVLLLLAVVPTARLAWLLAAPGELPAHPLMAGGIVLPLLIGVIFTVYLCLVLTHERTVRDLRETQRQLRLLADIDMLTQVPNRRHFEELAGNLLNAGGTVNAERAVLMLFDIDHFKRINDSRGHAAGDEALRLVARCSREALRTRDVIGRVGGDEFMLLLPAAAIEDALQIADRITRRLDAESAARGTGPLSLSFGVVEVEVDETLEAAQMRVDLALYEAKRQGRRRAVHATRAGSHTVFDESRPLGLTRA